MDDAEKVRLIRERFTSMCDSYTANAPASPGNRRVSLLIPHQVNPNGSGSGITSSIPFDRACLLYLRNQIDDYLSRLDTEG